MRDRKEILISYAKQFQSEAMEIEIKVKQNARVVERLAEFLARPGKKALDSNQVDFLMDFCIKVSELGESVLKANYERKKIYEEILSWNETWEAADVANTIQMQSDTITKLMETNEIIKGIASDVKRSTGLK